MKTFKIWAVALCFIGAGILSAQETNNEEKIELQNKKHKEESINNIEIAKHSEMSKFEPDYVASPEERVEQKKQRIVEAYRQKSILDTLDISDRKRKKLIRDLSDSPFSDRLSKAVIVETKFEDEE